MGRRPGKVPVLIRKRCCADFVQTWGIELVDGQRRYARHVNFTGPKGEKVKTKMYYDYGE